MFLYGEFINTPGQVVRVEILTEHDSSVAVEIGAEESGIFFDADPVHVDCEVNDTLDHTIRHSALIRLQTDRYIPGLYCSSCLDASVKIFRDGVCLFSGYVEPQTYTQDFNSVADILEVNCIDALSALQYAKFAGIGEAGVDYEEEKSKAGLRSFAELLEDAVSSVSQGDIFYDGSVTLPGYPDNVYSPHLFTGVSIPSLLFFGDEEDETWSLLDIVDEIMRYLNLRIVQLGEEFYVFSWTTVKEGKPVTWTSMADGTKRVATPSVVTFTEKNVADDNTTISVGEVYSRVMLTDSVTPMETLVESPLEKDSLYSPFANRQLYLSIYGCAQGLSYGDYKKCMRNVFSSFGVNAPLYINDKLPEDVNPSYIGYDDIYQDWYMQVKDNLRWKFFSPYASRDLITEFAQTGTWQNTIPDILALHGGAGIISLGKWEFDRETAVKDNSPVSKIDMQDYLVITVNGNEKDTAAECYPNKASLLRQCPKAEYCGPVTGGVFSPADDDTTNYIIFSGDMILNPVTHATFSADCVMDGKGVTANHGTGANERWRDRDYATCYRWMRAATPFSTPVDKDNNIPGLMPFTDKGPQLYEFSWPGS